MSKDTHTLRVYLRGGQTLTLRGIIGFNASDVRDNHFTSVSWEQAVRTWWNPLSWRNSQITNINPCAIDFVEIL